MESYDELIASKITRVSESGFDINPDQLNQNLFPFQRHIVQKALKAGRYAIFADCGLGKTLMQLCFAEEVVKFTSRPVVILTPLAVAAQTLNEARKFQVEGVVRWMPEMAQNAYLPDVIYVAHYEQLDSLPVDEFVGVILDESSILKNFTGATKRAILEAFSDTPYKLACTATPSPNDLNEIGNHSEFLNVLDAQDMRAKWFVRDEGMNNYRLQCGRAVGTSSIYPFVLSEIQVRFPLSSGYQYGQVYFLAINRSLRPAHKLSANAGIIGVDVDQLQ
ncbi:DNA methylase N-4/N-6 domain protein [Fibrisoma limi BUZ 3]|uniref:DNA methylase N-4/N-6 domain protein n=1 Tax=Fibrisoma limi BUZ 3 TaxID=1185876 RepID=I2GKS5_9BACT|nr:DEAD/DEAH box helicase family protein [Fibrisoma limi]CCH54501.1 DNA methylase N-4/N-6 domain protein [Fibrisoma limi BUZ 3]